MFLCGHASVAITYKDYRHTLFFVKGYSEVDSECEYFKIKGTSVWIKMDREHDFMCIYWESYRFSGLTSLCDYVTDYCQLPIHKLSTSCDRSSSDPKKALDWVFNRQETLPVFSFAGDTTGDEEFRYFWDKILQNRIKKLFLFVQPSENFRYNFRQQLTADMIDFEEALWISLQNLYDLNSRWLHIKATYLTSEDMNSFLKNWMNGGNSNLGFLKLGLLSIDVEVILNGIQFVRRVHRMVYHHWTGEPEKRFSASYELRKSDGTIASIVMDDEQIRGFYMFVWPDCKMRPYPIQELE
ncbi:unnamed protein product [Caenorhabditis brenneri]